MSKIKTVLNILVKTLSSFFNSVALSREQKHKESIKYCVKAVKYTNYVHVSSRNPKTLYLRTKSKIFWD